MLQLALIVLLFNLTCTTSDFGDSPLLGGFGVEGKHLQVPDSEKSITNKQANVNTEAGASIKVNTNIFSDEKDNAENVNSRQINKDNSKDTHQNPENAVNAQVQDNRKILGTDSKEHNDANSKVVKPNEPPKQPTNKNITSENKNSTLPVLSHSKEDVIQSGALRRGFYVFLGLSVITMMYFIFRSYRLRHGSQPSTTIKKYGVTARRSDMEMRPLELEDEDDDTLFEIGNHNVNR